MTGGTATTTITYDSYFSGNNTKTDSALLVFQFQSSGTPATLKFRAEDSNDGVDYYPRGVATIANATTTSLTAIFSEYSFVTSTSTDMGGTGLASTTGASAVMQSLEIKTPMRYVRVKFYIPIGGDNGDLWAQIVPVKERN